MKKVIYICLVVVSMGTTSAFALDTALRFGKPSCGQNVSGFQLVKLTDVTEEMLSAYGEGTCQNVILECPEGAEFPLSLGAGGEFLSMTGEELPPYKVKILKTCYIKCMGDELLFSGDLAEWKEFVDFFKGQFSVAINASNGRPELIVSTDLNQR